MPDYAPAHLNLGMALDGRGQAGEALLHYQKALDLAIARNDRALAEAVLTHIRSRPSVAPAAKAP